MLPSDGYRIDDGRFADNEKAHQGGADTFFEVIGKVETYKQAFECIHMRSTAIIVGGAPPAVSPPG